jgi:hypothetical protein
VLYNLDRKAAYDLAGADTPKKVGEILNKRLINAEHLDNKEFAKVMQDFADPNGRFAYFAQLHGWVEILAEAGRTFDLKSEENKDRLGAYDLKTAVYRFCRILGVTPTYQLEDGTMLTDGRDIDPNLKSLVRSEMRKGNLTQWMSVFYHEDPAQDFNEQYSYERELEKWVMALGDIDQSQTFYKRFVDACNETSRKMNEVRSGWRNAKRKEDTWRYVFYGLCGLWMLLVLIFGVTGRDFLLRHAFITIGLPLGGMTAIIVATRAYFRGYGSLMSALWGLLGACTAFIPIMTLKLTHTHAPAFFNVVIVLLTLLYMLVCHLTDFRGDQKADNKLINEVMEDDIQSTLIEPLFYTFKTKSFRFKGSKFGLLDDVSDQVRSISGESVLHYILWSLLVAGLVAEFVVFSPKLLNFRNPYLDGNWKLQPTKVIKQLEKDVE